MTKEFPSKPQTIFITGATSGIGHALALAYAAAGTTLLLAGRDAARLAAVEKNCIEKGATVKTSPLSVTDKNGWEKQLQTWNAQNPIDLAIANAGISGGTGKAGGESEAQFREIMAVNLDGTFNTLNPLIPLMQTRRKGHLVLMSSMAGFRGLPSAPAYSLSKSAVRAYAEALRPLLAQDNVAVSVICPGFIRTPMTEANKFRMPWLMDVEKATTLIQQGIAKNKAVIAFPLPFRLMMLGLNALPRCLSDKIVSSAPKKG